MNELKKILEELRPDVDFENEKELVTGGVFDSFDLISLMSMIEDEFCIMIKPALITKENFDSIESIYALINQLQKKG